MKLLDIILNSMADVYLLLNLLLVSKLLLKLLQLLLNLLLVVYIYTEMLQFVLNLFV
jgi:hypothetical protein